MEGSSHAKPSSIRSSVSIEHRLVTDRQTDGRTQGHGQYRGCIASRGKNRPGAGELHRSKQQQCQLHADDHLNRLHLLCINHIDKTRRSDIYAGRRVVKHRSGVCLSVPSGIYSNGLPRGESLTTRPSYVSVVLCEADTVVSLLQTRPIGLHCVPPKRPPFYFFNSSVTN